MAKPFLLTILLCLGLSASVVLKGQTAYLCREVLASTGGDAFVGGMHFEFTLGESVIETIGNSSKRLTQGFHQPEICGLTVSVTDISKASGLSVFPNPTSGELFLSFASPVGNRFQLEVFNSIGQRIKYLPMVEDTNGLPVDCRAFPSGTYFLVARNVDGGLFFEVPFIKADR